MIFGIGTDLVEVARIEKIILKEQGFKEKVFTKGEIAYCESRKNSFESYAARFAAKESFFKALGTGWVGEMQFHEIEIIQEQSGKPAILLHGEVKSLVEGLQISSVFVTLSHTSGMASGFVILEKTE